MDTYTPYRAQGLKEYIKGRSCGILGLGVSNLPLAKMIAEAGIPLTVRDKKTPSQLGDAALALEAAGVRFVSGEGCFDTVEEELIFRSPGIRPDRGGLLAAAERGAEITSEMELFLKLCPTPIFAVTGSDGKTTTTTLTGLFLTEALRAEGGGGRVFVGGNIGKPLLEEIGGMTRKDRAVLELSSFQLMTVKDAPSYAAITNITPNHLDWHGEMAEYIEAKRNIIGPRTKRAVVNANDPTACAIGEELLGGEAEVIFFSSAAKSPCDIPQYSRGGVACILKDGYITLYHGDREEKALDVARIRVPGKHNIENFMTAISLTWGHVPTELYGAVADSFCGVEHRLEWIRELEGVDYYNSSIDSSPTRTAAALSALWGERGREITVICGGYDKKIPYGPLAEALFRYASAVVLTGATADKIYSAIEEYREHNPIVRELKVLWGSDFEDAAAKAKDCAEEIAKAHPDIRPCVVLSPASASFDVFNNFAERGETFKNIVRSF